MNQKVYNTLLGLAIGDAYGAHFEFMEAQEIAQSSMQKPNKSLGGGPFAFLPGDFSDDTEMALLTLYSLMQKGLVDTHHIKELYTLWSYHAKDVGVQTQRALQQGIVDPRGEGNGSLMRILPSVVYMHEVLHWDNETIKKAVHAISSITHDTINIHRVNDLFIDLLLGTDTIVNHFPLLIDLLYTNGNSGWVINTARIVHFTFTTKNLSVLDGLWKIISYGGDTDTACAIYMALRAYHDEQLLQQLPIDNYLNQESQRMLSTFHEISLHYYQPDRQKMPTLFAGQYPGSKYPVLHAIKMQELLSLECDCVISLMEKAESVRFRSYQDTLRLLNPAMQFVNFPIVDMSVPSTHQLHETIQFIIELLKDNKKVYVHCWGGHGRTGVIVASLLISKGYSSKEALEKIKEERMKTLLGDESSPQTYEQIKFVFDITQTARVEQDVHQ